VVPGFDVDLTPMVFQSWAVRYISAARLHRLSWVRLDMEGTAVHDVCPCGGWHSRNLYKRGHGTVGWRPVRWRGEWTRL